MPNKRDKEREQEEIKITDRRRFSVEGDVIRSSDEEPAQPETPVKEPPSQQPPKQEPPTPKPPAQEPPPAPPAEKLQAAAAPIPDDGEGDLPEPPTAAEQQASRDAFTASSAKIDAALHEALGAQHRPEAMKVSFETFIAELYMTAMFQMGMLAEKGQQPQVDIVGARHSIDTLVMLDEKTRNNLTDVEKNVLQDCLFRLRMAFVEITNLLTRPPEPGKGGPGGPIIR